MPKIVATQQTISLFVKALKLTIIAMFEIHWKYRILKDIPISRFFSVLFVYNASASLCSSKVKMLHFINTKSSFHSVFKDFSWWCWSSGNSHLCQIFSEMGINTSSFQSWQISTHSLLLSQDGKLLILTPTNFFRALMLLRLKL